MAVARRTKRPGSAGKGEPGLGSPKKGDLALEVGEQVLGVGVMAGAETGTGAPVDPSGAGGTPRPRRMGSSTSRRVTRRKNMDTRELAFA